MIKLISRLFMMTENHINHLYSEMRTLKKIPDTRTVLNLTEDLKKFKEKSFANLSYIYCATYKPRSGFEPKLLTFERELAPRLSTFSDVTFLRIILNFKYVYRRNYNKMSKEILESFIQRAEQYSSKDTKLKIYYELGILSALFKANNINYESTFQKFFEDFFTEKTDLNKEDLLSLLELYSRLNLSNPYIFSKLEEKKKLFKIVIQGLNDGKLSFDETQSAMILRSLILLNYSDEDEIRLLEAKVIKNLKNLSDQEFSQFLSAYRHRVAHDYFYMINEILKYFYEEIINRFCTMSVILLNQTFSDYKKISLLYGMVCDERIVPVIENYLQSFNRGMETWDKVNLLLNISSFCSLSGFLNNTTIGLKVHDLISPELPSMTHNHLLILAQEFSRFSSIPASFWVYFSTKIHEIYASSTKSTYLYAIHLNLSLQRPEYYSLISDSLSTILPSLRSQWFELRTRDISSSQTSKLQNDLGQILTSLQLEFSSEYFHEYYIDFAIPEKKIAYEVLGPGHYIFPSSSLNGRTQNKKKEPPSSRLEVHRNPLLQNAAQPKTTKRPNHLYNAPRLILSK